MGHLGIAGVGKRIFIAVAGVALLAATGCMEYQPPPPLPRLPESKWGEVFTYRYDLPKDQAIATPGSVPVTVAVVNLYYNEEDSALKSSSYSKVGKGFSNSMGVDADKILIAKGMKSLGPFPTLDEMTWVQKKQAALTFAPRVFITTKVKYLNNWYLIKGSTERSSEEYRMCRDFQMKLGGWISFVMQEPLSGEKMWVKRLELDEKEISWVELCGVVPQYQETYGFFGEPTGKVVVGYSSNNEIVMDGKIDVVADYIKSVYPVIMSKFWTYLDAEEMQQLKKQTEDIRERKRY